MLKFGEASQEAVTTLESQGFFHAQKQSEFPEMPKELTDLDGEELSQLFSKLTAWSNYIATQLSAAQVDERSAEKTLENASARIMVTRMGQKTTGERITAIKAEVSIDPKILGLADLVEKAYAYRKMVEVMFYNLERDTALVSREITRRSSDFRAGRKDRFNA
jgi:arginine utilization protein RocB